MVNKLFLYLVWPLNLKIKKSHVWCTSVQNLMSNKQRINKILSGQYFPMSSLTLELYALTSKPIRVINSLRCTVYKVWCLSRKGLSRYWLVSIFICPFWPLDLWPQNQYWSSTSHDVLVYKVWSLSRKRFSRYWVVRIFICPVRPLDFWTFDLKINDGHLLFMMFKSTTFVCQAKGSQHID